MSGDAADLAEYQSHANCRAGPRSLPARTVPVPPSVRLGDAALIVAPYAPTWNAAPADAAGWSDLQRNFADRIEPVLARLRDDLGVALAATVVGGVGAYRLTPRALPDVHRGQTVVVLHGGGYVVGGGAAGTAEATLLAAIGGYDVVSIDYRLAPRTPFPAALDDANSAWRALAAASDPRRIAVVGVLAGGGLALALMQRLAADDLPRPAALALASPWADLTPTGDSYATNEWLDNVLVSYDGFLGRAARAYAGDTDLTRAELSPINGNFAGMPPTILATGTRDLFLSNTVRCHRKLRDAAVVAELHVHEGMSHAQFALHPAAAATSAFYREVAAFFDRFLAR